MKEEEEERKAEEGGKLNGRRSETIRESIFSHQAMYHKSRLNTERRKFHLQ